MCKGCPFNYGSEESQYAQTAGCLPDPAEIREQHVSHGKNWACHESKKLCDGFVRDCKRRNVPVNITNGLYFEVGVHSNIRYDLNRIYELKPSAI